MGDRIDHELKCYPTYFQMVIDGIKPFELRNNDRNFKTGQLVRLREYDQTNSYSGRDFIFRISCVIDTPQYLQKGYVALGIARPKSEVMGDRLRECPFCNMEAIPSLNPANGKLPMLAYHPVNKCILSGTYADYDEWNTRPPQLIEGVEEIYKLIEQWGFTAVDYSKPLPSKQEMNRDLAKYLAARLSKPQQVDVEGLVLACEELCKEAFVEKDRFICPPAFAKAVRLAKQALASHQQGLLTKEGDK